MFLDRARPRVALVTGMIDTYGRERAQAKL